MEGKQTPVLGWIMNEAQPRGSRGTRGKTLSEEVLNLSSIKSFHFSSPCSPCSPWFFCSTQDWSLVKIEERETAMSDNTISFDQIPRTSRLFNDFLYNFDRVSRFYQHSGLDVSALVARAPKVAAQTFSRDAVADALADQNARAGAGDQTFANI